VNKKHESIDNYLERLEREATNELQEFVALHPSYYTTDHLLDLRRQWLSEMQLFRQMQKMNLTIGACAPIWLGVGRIHWRFLKRRVAIKRNSSTKI